jgi:hypothetical protein
MESVSIIHVVLSNTESGLLQGNYVAYVALIDHSNGRTVWENSMVISFDNGAADISMGPLPNLGDVELPRAIVKIDKSQLEFPIVPTFFALHAQTAEQLADRDAIYIDDNHRVGIGTQTPESRLTVNGNIQFVGDGQGIYFRNGRYLDSDYVDQSIERMDAIQDQLNQLSLSEGANLRLDATVDHTLLVTNTVGEIAPLNEFYKLDSNYYFLYTNQQAAQIGMFSDQFRIDNNTLFIESTDSIVLLPTAALPGSTESESGEFRYFNNRYYMMQDSVWQEVMSKPAIASSTLLQWTNDTLGAATLGEGLSFGNGELNLAAPLYINTNQLGIGVLPTETLDINGALRLRTTNRQEMGTVSDGTVVFDADNFYGWTGTEWKLLSSTMDSVSISSDFWTYNGNDLVLNPNQNVGIKGDSPQATLDINGSLRLRTTNRHAMGTVSDGTVVFDADNFYGWTGTEWKLLSSTMDSVSISSDAWTYNGSDLVTNPNQNVGIKVGSPQATLDINGSLRVRGVASSTAWLPFMMIDAEGDVVQNPLTFSDIMQQLSSDPVASNSLLMYDGTNWGTSVLTGAYPLTQTGATIQLTTQGNPNDILRLQNGAWEMAPLIDPVSMIEWGMDGLTIRANNAAVGDVLTWDGGTWLPTSPEPPMVYTGTNGVAVNGTSISLESGLNWLNNQLTIGTTDTPASLYVNALQSTPTSPIKIIDSNGATQLDINNQGQISIGLDGDHGGYAFASNGFNFLSSIVTDSFVTIGLANNTALIGTLEFGPTLLIRSISPGTVAPSPTRSIVEILDPEGNVRFEVQDSGYVGINQSNPKATLDVDGFVKLQPYTEPPVACSLDQGGSIALTQSYQLCVCNTTNWVHPHDGTSCQWTQP